MIDAFVVFGLSLTGLKIHEPEKRSWSLPGSRGWGRRTRLFSTGRAVTGLFQQFTLSGGQRKFSGIDAPGRQLKHVLLRGVSVLTFKKYTWLCDESSTASTTTDPEWRMTSRMAVTPLGSCTRSRVTWKMRPLKTVLDERTSAVAGRRVSRRMLLGGLRVLRAGMPTNIKQPNWPRRRARLILLCCGHAKSKRKARPSSIVGPGNLGSALAMSLSRAGYRVRCWPCAHEKECRTTRLKLARRDKCRDCDSRRERLLTPNSCGSRFRMTRLPVSRQIWQRRRTGGEGRCFIPAARSPATY